MPVRTDHEPGADLDLVVVAAGHDTSDPAALVDQRGDGVAQEKVEAPGVVAASSRSIGSRWLRR